MRWCCLLALPACVGGGPRSLSELHAVHVDVDAADTVVEYPMPQQFSPGFTVLLETLDCTPLADDVTASFAGMPLVFAVEAHDRGCLGVRASLDGLAPGAFDGKTTTLEIRDSTETWTTDVPSLHDASVALASQLAAGQPASVAWTDGPLIWNGRLHLETSSATFDIFSTVNPGWQFPTRAGDPATVTIPSAASGPARASIELSGTGTGTCDGPASCYVSESVAAAFDVAITP